MADLRDVREELLNSAYDAAVGGDWDRVRMADVAAAAQVSRQTLYNEFGSKEGLAEALSMREAERFLEVVEVATKTGETPAVAIRQTVFESLLAASENPLIKAALTGAHSSELLRLLAANHNLIQLADDRLAAGLLERFPALDVHSVAIVSDVVVRLTISHLMSPDGPAEHVAASIERLVAPLLEDLS